MARREEDKSGQLSLFGGWDPAGDDSEDRPPSRLAAPAHRRRPAIELVHGDFLKLAQKHVEPGTIDAVITSPPYNIGIQYSTYKDDLPREEYQAWTDAWAAQVKRCLSETGSLFLNVGVRPKEPWLAWEVAGIFRRHLELQNVIHWVKSISIAKRDVGRYPGVTQDISVGHYKPINSDRFVNDQHEYIFHFTHSGEVTLDRLAIGVPYQDTSNIRRWKSAGGGLHCRGNTWFIPYPTIKYRDKDRPHPASFPVALPEMCLRLHGLVGVRRVMDPFMGLGTTGVAAARLGLDCIGFDIDEAYLAVARNQLAAEHCEVRGGK